VAELNSADAGRRHETLRTLMTGYKISQALYVVAKLGIADLLSEGPRPLDELARSSDSDARSLRRILHLLADYDFFAEAGDGSFRLTELGELLVSDAPRSDWAWILKEGELWWDAWRHLLECVRTGRPGFELAYGVGLFDYLAADATGDLARRTLTALSSAGSDTQVEGILEAYDFGAFLRVVDVGGGNGSLLFAALRAHRDMTGVLLDQPYVASLTRASSEAADVAERCEFVEGDFFEAVPAGGELYVLRSVLHDWDDERALTILRSCRRVVPPSGRLLVIEVLMPGEDATREERLSASLRDVNLMVMTSGGKRTPEELRNLLARAGFETQRVIPTGAAFGIIEAVPTEEGDGR
jgi:SAM-dependent methyltransferase